MYVLNYESHFSNVNSLILYQMMSILFYQRLETITLINTLKRKIIGIITII